MPCNTTTTQSVALAKAMPEIVEETLKGLHWVIKKSSKTEITAERLYGTETVTWTAEKGLTIRSVPSMTQALTTELTKAYSKTAVTWAAKRAGWTVQQTVQDKLTVSRR